MTGTELMIERDLARRLSEAEAVIEALLSGQIDAVVDTKSKTPVLLSKAQDALRESETRYRSIVETASEGIWTIDTEFKITFVNRPLADMLGYPADEMLGKPLVQFVPATSAASPALRGERWLQGDTEEDVAFARRDGSELWALLKTSPIRDTTGHYIGTLAMMTDRTRHRQAEEALRKSEEQYRQIVEATSDGVLKVDTSARIDFVNRRFAQMLGYEPREMIGLNVFTLMSAVAKEMLSDSFERPPTGRLDALDSSLRHKDGNDIAVNIAGASLLDGEGQRVGNLAVVRDVTERKKLQSQLMVSDRMVSMGTLAAGVAHEINNPLTAVIANLDHIAENAARTIARAQASPAEKSDDLRFWDEMKAPLNDARDAAQRVRFIVRDLKMFSRSPVDELRRSVDVKAVMDSSLRMAWNEIRHRARLVKDYGSVPSVVANEARLGQVFLNLVVNAAQAMPEGRAAHNEIRVTIRLEGERVAVEVSDTGPGIPPQIIGRIFEAFFTTKEVGVGTGLGLAISQRIITDMAGQLTVASEMGKGTTFRVVLPVALEAQQKSAPPVEQVRVDGRRGRIMVVDDEIFVLRVVKRILANEHEVVIVTTAHEALTRCSDGEKFDLIICDLMMPNMTGMDLHREILRVDPEQASRMIFLTGGAFTEKARQFLEETHREHIDKPFDSANLRAIVGRHLGTIAEIGAAPMQLIDAAPPANAAPLPR